MKKILLGLAVALPALLTIISTPKVVQADYDQKAALDRGTYIQTYSYSGSSNTGTAFLSANVKRMDAVLFNNSSDTIWLGTTTATQSMVMHSNINIGIPVLSSATFSLDGLMSGELYFTCGNTVATCQVRVLEGVNR